MMEEEFAATMKVLRAIPEAHKDWRPDPKAKSAFELAWHIVESERWFLECLCAGEFRMDDEAETLPADVRTIEEVIARHRDQHGEMMEKIRGIAPEVLATTMPFMGFLELPWIQYLMFMLNHGIHHRGQLSTYLRPMGSKVPPIYGGSADEPFKPDPA